MDSNTTIDNNTADSNTNTKYIVVDIDWSNCQLYKTLYDTCDDALRYILNDLLNVDKTEEWFNQNNIRLYVNEYNSKLYNHWMRLEYNQYSQLFENDTKSTPHTIAELKEYITDGNILELLWSSRAPSTIYMISINYTDDKKTNYLDAAINCPDLMILNVILTRKSISDKEKIVLLNCFASDINWDEFYENNNADSFDNIRNYILTNHLEQYNMLQNLIN